MTPPLQVLALNPYHAGSHRALLEGWSKQSQLRFTSLTLPAFKWKWRMRHAAISFAEQARRLAEQGERWDVVFCTDMLNLAEFRGLAPLAVAGLPAVVYFHENQLTYPDPSAEQRDLHFAFTNFVTGLAADHVWFNSAFHRDDFLAALTTMVQRMPDHQPTAAVEQIRARSEIFPPGIERPRPRPPRSANRPLRLVWAARWEHDKAPETLFDAIRVLQTRQIDFELNVLGESFARVPACFEHAKRDFAQQIKRWGFLADRQQYLEALADSDVMISTANHEFFGIAMVEAVAAGCYPLAPYRLAYPEVLGTEPDWFFDGSVENLADRLSELEGRLRTTGRLWQAEDRSHEMLDRFSWDRRADAMDRALIELVAGH